MNFAGEHCDINGIFFFLVRRPYFDSVLRTCVNMGFGVSKVWTLRRSLYRFSFSIMVKPPYHAVIMATVVFFVQFWTGSPRLCPTSKA